MILGFSDAKLCITKRGPEEVREQGLLCQYIGEKVCPRVYKILEDGYEMEVLEPPPNRGADMLQNVLDLLAREVWPRRAYNEWNSGWLDRLIVWSYGAPWLTAPIRLNYPTEPEDGNCLIHGDPALSNLMCRGKKIVITDPMPRLGYRSEIPNRKEVDLGKLIQSAAGWERMLGCHDSLDGEIYLVADQLGDAVMRRLAYLWGAIHLARVGIRARTKGRNKIARWAEDTSRMLGAMSC